MTPIPTAELGDAEKARLFLSVFRGREDIIAERWQTRAGKLGFSPKCSNRSKPICKFPCRDCQNFEAVPLSNELLRKHFRGELVLGSYPLLRDGTCYFIGADLDNHGNGASPRDPLADAIRFRDACELHGLTCYLFRSRGGRGVHIYLFFEKAVPAWKARAVVFALLQEAQVIGEDAELSSFDRLFSSQDRLTGKEYGNLIALAFQGQAAKQGHTLFLDPATGFREPYPKQMEVLAKIERVPESKLNFLIEEWNLTSTSRPDTGRPGQARDDVLEAALRCDFLKWAGDKQAEIPEPLWYPVISNLARLPGGPDLCHDFSRKHPGYSREETDSKILHALNGSGPHSCGWLADNGFPCPSLGTGRCKREASPAAFVQRCLKPGQAEPVNQKGTPLSLIRLGDLLREPEELIEWVVDGILPAGGSSLLAGKPKAGKSTLARELSLRVSRGGSFLERSTTQGPIIYLALEEKRSQLRGHFRDMGATGEEEIFIHTGIAPDKALDLLRKEAENRKPALIVIDPLFRLVRVQDCSAYAEVTRALEPVHALARDTGAHVLLVHHMGKNDREGGDGILGSTAIFGAVDTALLLKRTPAYRTLSSVQRYGTDLEGSVLHFDPENRTTTIGESREAEEENRIGKAIEEFLRDQTEPVKESVFDDVEGRVAIKRKALRRLVASRRVERIGKGGKADPFKYAAKCTTRFSRDRTHGGDLMPRNRGDS